MPLKNKIHIFAPPCNILPSFTMKEIFIIIILEFLKKSAHVWKIKIKSGKMVGNLAFFFFKNCYKCLLLQSEIILSFSSQIFLMLSGAKHSFGNWEVSELSYTTLHWGYCMFTVIMGKAWFLQLSRFLRINHSIDNLRFGKREKAGCPVPIFWAYSYLFLIFKLKPPIFPIF